MPSATTAWSSAMRIRRAMDTFLLVLGPKRVNVPVVPTSTGLKSAQKWVSPSFSDMDKVEFTALGWLALLALVATGALLRVRPHERLTFLNTLWLFFLGIAGQAVAVTLLALDLPRASGAVHTLFRIVTAVALIRLFGFVIFRLLLPFAGKRPTRIV